MAFDERPHAPPGLNRQMPLATIIQLYAGMVWEQEVARLGGWDVAAEVMAEVAARLRTTGPAPSEPGFLRRLVELMSAATFEIAPAIAIEVRQAVTARVKGDDPPSEDAT